MIELLVGVKLSRFYRGEVYSKLTPDEAPYSWRQKPNDVPGSFLSPPKLSPFFFFLCVSVALFQPNPTQRKTTTTSSLRVAPENVRRGHGPRGHHWGVLCGYV